MKNLILAFVVTLTFSTVALANKAKAPIATPDYSMSAVRVEARELVKALNLQEAEYVLVKKAMGERNEAIAEAGRRHGVNSAAYAQAIVEQEGKMDAAVLKVVGKYNKQGMYLAYKRAHSTGLISRN